MRFLLFILFLSGAMTGWGIRGDVERKVKKTLEDNCAAKLKLFERPQ